MITTQVTLIAIFQLNAILVRPPTPSSSSWSSSTSRMDPSRGAGSAVATVGFSDVMQAFVEKFKIDEPVRKLLIEKEIFEPLDFSLIAENESECVKVLGTALGSPLDPLTSAVRVKKLYTFCCASKPALGDTPTTPHAKVGDDEENLPEGVPEQIERKWMDRHGFHLSGARLLAGGDYNRVYNCIVKKKPREIPKMDPEKFKLLSEGISGESKGLLLLETGGVVARKSYYSEIIAHDQLWWRIRAFLSTISYLTVLIEQFFPFQVCENFCDSLHDVIMAPSGGGRLPIIQCKVAWKNMISAMQIKVRQTDCNLAELADNEMFWKHHWAWHAAPRAPPSEWAPETPSSGAASSGDKAMIQSLLDQNRNLKERLEVGRKFRGGKKRNNKRSGGDDWEAEGRVVPTPPAPPTGQKRNGDGGKGAQQKAWFRRQNGGKKGGGK